MSSTEVTGPEPVVRDDGRVACGHCGHDYDDIHPATLSRQWPYEVGPHCGGCFELHPLILRYKNREEVVEPQRDDRELAEAINSVRHGIGKLVQLLEARGINTWQYPHEASDHKLSGDQVPTGCTCDTGELCF